MARLGWVLLILLSHFCALAETTETCLMVSATNLSKGAADFFLRYYIWSGKPYNPRKGDLLEYDLYLDPSNPETTGGLDINVRGEAPNFFAPQVSLRSSVPIDVSEATGKWHHFRVPLDSIAGHETANYLVTFDGDKEGTYTQFLDNAVIKSADGSTYTIYDSGLPNKHALKTREGYSRRVCVMAVPREKVVQDSPEMRAQTRQWLEKALLLHRAEEMKAELLALQTADAETSRAMQPGVARLTEVTSLTLDQPVDTDAFLGALHEVQGPLRHLHERMRQYTGHLIGHAHIDFQWLWEWPETVNVCRDTFRQATKFMEEFPGFTFTQSSSALYSVTEETWPEVFQSMKRFIEKGQWEIVGGRVCEGDTYMISPESHARHFLYGQRYFRERFNKTAIVGWEPDTFGHAWTMPQILKLGGCRYYYFCRGGHGKPLFWWEGPDGSRVLAFEEPATGSWYNADVTYEQFKESFAFAKGTGSKDMLWVYGVGNHGGGPTREHIETAREWQTRDYVPQVKFSTATDFFTRLEKHDLTSIPLVRTELNTTSSSGFFGTYTSHGDIKRWNRDAEAITESAEAIAFVASRFGFKYPTELFRATWEDICWNHHHDTLPGTSIHPSYNKSEQMYRKAVENSSITAASALEHVGKLVQADQPGVIVFNPTGWRRNGLVEVPLPKAVGGGDLVALSGNSKRPLQRLENDPSRAIMYAQEIPAMGYRRYRIAERPGVPGTEHASLRVNGEGTRLENARYIVNLDPKRGLVTSILDKQTGKDAIRPEGSGNRLEVHMEEPNGMSAWMIGKIKEVKTLEDPVKFQVAEWGPARVAVKWTRKYENTELRQAVYLPAGGAPEFSLDTEWKVLGSAEKGAPFLKVAFDLNAGSTTDTYELPYGNIERPANGQEYPALKWVDCSGQGLGAALINDSKHGYSCLDGTIRLSLIRSSYYPDPNPNDRPQHMKWSLMPHDGNWREARVVQEAQEFNRPMLSALVDANSDGELPEQLSFVRASRDDVIITGLKKAEGDNDMIVRFYEAFGTMTSGAISSAFSLGNPKSVNFVEDEILESNPGSSLRPYEIRTLKIPTSSAVSHTN